MQKRISNGKRSTFLRNCWIFAHTYTFCLARFNRKVSWAESETSDKSKVDHYLTGNLITILLSDTSQFPEGWDLYMFFNLLSWHVHGSVGIWEKVIFTRCNIKWWHWLIVKHWLVLLFIFVVFLLGATCCQGTSLSQQQKSKQSIQKDIWKDRVNSFHNFFFRLTLLSFRIFMFFRMQNGATEQITSWNSAQFVRMFAYKIRYWFWQLFLISRIGSVSFIGFPSTVPHFLTFPLFYIQQPFQLWLHTFS